MRHFAFDENLDGGSFMDGTTVRSNQLSVERNLTLKDVQEMKRAVTKVSWLMLIYWLTVSVFYFTYMYETRKSLTAVKHRQDPNKK